VDCLPIRSGGGGDGVVGIGELVDEDIDTYGKQGMFRDPSSLPRLSVQAVAVPR